MPKLINPQTTEVQRNSKTKSLLKLRGSFDLSQSDSNRDGGDAVLSFLKDNAGELELDFKNSDLSLVHTAVLPDAKVKRYQQTVDNIPVHDAYVLVQTDDNSIKQIDLNYAKGKVDTSRGDAPVITPAQAEKIATADLKEFTMRGDSKIITSKMYFNASNKLTLSYNVLIMTENPLCDWNYFIDATNGKILEKKDIIKHLPDGSGFVFDPNPVVTANNNTLRQPTATTAAGCGYAGTALATIDAQRVTRVLKDLKLSGGVYSLEGAFAKIINITSPTSTIPTETSPTAFNYSSSDERLGAVNLYYHIDTIQRYIQSLGITTANNRQTAADPAVSGFSAYYSPGNKSLHMGTSRPCHPDKSQEGDAIIHEYGHAIQDNQVPGWGTTNPVTGRDEAGAMGEGWGDILACVFFASFGNQFQRESFEDWAYVENGASALRRVDGTKVYPTSWSSEVHNDGEIWSAALWNIYRTIGGDSLNLADRNAARDALLKTVILSHHLLLPSASMPDGAEAIMKTHADSSDYRGKYLMQMLDSFHARGILKCNASADLYIRDDAADTGNNISGASVFWNSPDLWITKTPISTNPAEHENPEKGQDNYFHARVTNRGTQAARAFVVTFNVKTWAGTQFVYPGDFIPFISAAVGFNLAPGASTIVHAKWPKALIPPSGTHSCWISSVYMPTDTTPSGKHVWEYNNLAQKNLHIVDLIPGDSFVLPIQFNNFLIREIDRFRVEIVRPKGFAAVPVSLTHPKELELATFFNSEKEALIDKDIKAKVNRIKVKFSETTEAVFAKAAGANPASVVFKEGLVAGFPVVLKPGQVQTFNLKVTAPPNVKPGDSFQLNLLQRDPKNVVIGGFTVQVRIKKK
ncbi:M36 family metallopeptidase [Ferruginibacter sp. SUN106]|uniref:M36 family metallopeptidase n=1 Tax=Ferruginibacter sp. SUN106 TaxID=2978348 RepID=UPI003D35ABDE